MKKLLNPKYLPLLTLGFSGIGIALCIWFLNAGIDEKGFLESWHIANILLWLLTAVTVAILFLHTRPLKGQGRYTENFPASVPAAIGCWAAAAGIMITALGDLISRPDFLCILADILGLLSFPALLLAGYCRLKGQRSSFLCYVVVCFHFTLRLMCQYRQWSSDPILQDYCFQLLAGVGLMLWSYHRAAFDVNLGKRPSCAFTGLITVFFCCVALPATEQKLFFLTTAAWILTNQCSLDFHGKFETHSEPATDPDAPNRV